MATNVQKNYEIFLIVFKFIENNKITYCYQINGLQPKVPNAFDCLIQDWQSVTGV